MQQYIQLLLEAVEKYADEPALADCKGERITDYRTFGDLMYRTAAWINKKELPERSFIPVRFPSSMEFAATVCGVWLSGHAAVPMGDSFPEERVSYICKNCESPFVIDDHVIDEIRGTEPVDISIFPESEDDDVAFLMYTSGSTGMPKGILHNFRALCANQQMGSRQTYSTGQAWAMGAPFYFVASVAVYKVLTCGGLVHLLDEETMRDVRKLEDYYAKHGITVGFISPSVLANFHSRSDKLKIVMTGSERLTGQYGKDGYLLFNNYGMSETMGTICSFKVEKPYDTTPVGIPSENIEWALLDEDMNPVPEGEEGEMCLKGQFTVGYYKDPEATDNLYRGGWLHTGDILKKLPDGNLVYINRKDWMIKINGQRVEPGEIENVLSKIPGVKSAAVKAIDGPGGKTALCAWYTGEKMENEQIKEELGKKLAAYMIPSFYVHLDEFPINQNGKVDRKNLPMPDMESNRAAYVPPENEIQAMLCRAFEAALGISQAGIDDDFFSLGGDSIRVMKLTMECPELPLTSKMVYGAKTPRAIAKELENAGVKESRERKEAYPLSAAQLGIYIESIRRDGEAVYNNPILLELGKDVDMERLRKACEAVVAAHPYIKLKLTVDDNGDPVQHRNEEEAYVQADVEKLNESEFRECIAGLMQPFRLHKDRLFRIRLFETEAGKYIFLDLHHIIFDGSSMLVIFADLERAYRGETLEMETYSGFEVAEDERAISEERYEEAKRWYLDTFGQIEADSLPIPDRRDKRISFDSMETDLEVDISEVTQLCRSADVTENILATAAFGICAGLYSGVNEALFTTIYNGRDSLRTARTVAMLVKTLPVYAHFEREQTIKDYLQAAKEQMLACMNNDIYPFSKLVAETGITSDLLFVYQGDVLNVGGFAGEPVRRIPVMDNATGEQLALQLYKQQGIFHLRIEYRSDLYSQEFIRTLADSYENVLRTMTGALTVGEVSLAGYKQLNKLASWNETEVPYDKSMTVVSMFRGAALKYADNTALIFEDEETSYEEFDKESEKIAAYLEKQGLGSGDVASILIPRGRYQAIASMGALKAGLAYQPLDSTYPTERLNFMVSDASAGILITTHSLGELITDYNGPRLFLEDIDSLPDGKASAVPKPEDTFILLYTSGSTGVPKGVQLTHGNLVNVINWYRDYYGLVPEDRVGQYASYGFDACMMDMYPALTSGAAVCFVPEEMRLDLESMDRYYTKNRVTLAFLTTQVGRQFALETENPYLRAVSVGGEKLASMDPPKGVELINIYGPTECTILATVYKVKFREDNIPIGHPLPNMKCYVVDPFGHRVSPGALGELLLAGPQVGAGYLNRPEKTAEVFVQNPFDSGDCSHMYRTGDIVRYRQDGEIEFIGRHDGQVKIHGFRIELSEVEAVIRDYPGVKDAAVVARDLGDDGKAVAAYIVSEDKLDIKALSDFIRERKPPYMVPASIMQIDSIPLNQNGKVNKRALPEPVIEATAEDEGAHVDNVLEEKLRDIIGEALNMQRPGLSIPLEYLGLTSIGTIRLSTRLSKTFGVNIPVKEMQSLTITDIENRILSNWMEGDTANRELTELEEADSVLGAAQTGVYLECMKQPESTTYNIPSVLTFDTGISVDRLIAAVRKTLLAHPSVFVHFDIAGNELRAIRDEADPDSVDIPVLSMTEEERETYTHDFVTPFKLNRGPLFRFCVVTTDTACYLYVDFHHLIFDGFSMSLFLKDLGTVLKDGRIDGEGASYFAFVRDQQRLLMGEGQNEYDKYFAVLLNDYESSTEIAPDIVSGEASGHTGTVSEELDQTAVKKACERAGVTEAAFFLAALDLTLARLVSEDRVYIATISSGRSDIRFADVWGMFVNTMPLAAQLTDGSVDEFIGKVSKGFEDAIAHEYFPFAELAAKWGYSVKVMYEYQRGIVERPDIPNLTGVTGLGTDEAKFPMIVRIVDTESGPAIELSYDDGLYSETFAREIVRSMAIVVDKICQNGRCKVRSVSLLDDKRSEVIKGFHNRPELPEISDDTLFHTGLERKAAEVPDRMALIAADRNLTYHELDEEANRLANALIKRGTPKGSRIVLLLPRTSRVMIAIFGTLKAGMTYIPCDPNYPVERVRHIIEDSGAALIITTSDRMDRFVNQTVIDVEELLGEEDTTKPSVKVTGQDLAYMIYTSGSTGKPKGVMINHGNVANYVADSKGHILLRAMLEEGSVLTSITTLSFDMSLKEYALSLCNGLTLSLASDDECNDAVALAQRMKRTNTDIFSATPSRLLSLMESKDFLEALDACALVVCGGEKYPEKLLHALKERGFDKKRMFNTYGPTETTVSSNAAEITHYDHISVGKPLPGVEEYIVDTDGNEVPEGVVGELYIGGRGVSPGYYGLEEMTKERFIDYKGSRVYRSGDYARWLSNGDVEILGRRDNQIKLRGLRIELGEVESVMSSMPGIRQAAVRIDRINGIEHLCAWFTADEPVDIGELKKSLGRVLTNYMVPTAYEQLEEMPVTPNGKLDLKSLKTPQLYRAGGGEKPETAEERDFCAIFSKILHIDDVSVTENFFDLGGTSLLVTNMVIEAGGMGYQVTFGDVFDHPTPRELALLAGEGSRDNAPIYMDETGDDPEISDYDYSAIDRLLEDNTLNTVKDEKPWEMKQVLLTGATGYLGIHVLRELLDNTGCRVTCLLRSKDGNSAEDRLKRLCFYYFDTDYSELIGDRLFIEEGDVTDPDSIEAIGDRGIDTVINCAAVVKHFDRGTIIEDVNLGGAKNLIGFCLKHDAMLIQTSTMSVAATVYEGDIPDSFVPTEQKFYFGQKLDNKYIHSKFLAERAVLEAAAGQGLKAKIMRFGNLSARHSDGEFQINAATNSAMGRLRAFAILGCAAYDQLDTTMEFSPIDAVARALVILCTTPLNCRLFHVVNNQNITMASIFHELGEMGYPISFVEREQFAKRFSEVQSDPDKATKLTSIMAYMQAPGGRKIITLPKECRYTGQVLYRLGFQWPVTSWDYIHRFVAALDGMWFFE